MDPSFRTDSELSSGHNDGSSF